MSAQENRIRGGIDTDVYLPWRAAALELVSTSGVILVISQRNSGKATLFAKKFHSGKDAAHML